MRPKNENIKEDKRLKDDEPVTMCTKDAEG